MIEASINSAAAAAPPAGGDAPRLAALRHAAQEVA